MVKMEKIQVLIIDVDGTLTDGKVYMGLNGELMKAFNIKDGYAIVHFLPLLNIEPIIITGRSSDILISRCKELKITEVYQGVNNKINKLKEICEQKNITLNQVAYIGDDANDLECMMLCGLKACPCDAIPEVISICDFVSTKKGGDGAVREFIDYIKNNIKDIEK